MTVEALARETVDCAFNVYRDIGPGLLESVYEAVMQKVLEERGLRVERQKSVRITYKGIIFDEGFRIDLLVDDRLVVELKSVEKASPVHGKQVLT